MLSSAEIEAHGCVTWRYLLTHHILPILNCNIKYSTYINNRLQILTKLHTAFIFLFQVHVRYVFIGWHILFYVQCYNFYAHKQCYRQCCSKRLIATRIGIVYNFQRLPCCNIIVTYYNIIYIVTFGNIIIIINTSDRKRSQHFPLAYGSSSSCGTDIYTYVYIDVVALNERELNHP